MQHGKGKYLGLDFGDRRTGVAISDPDKSIAFPRDFIEYKRMDELIEIIRMTCEEDQISKIILGLPIQMNGIMGERAMKTQDFYVFLKKALPEIPIEFFDERLSTQYAVNVLRSGGVRAKDQKGKRDAISAQIILQNYLNSINRKV